MKRNIYILTLPLGYNYGGILQNYALQQVLIEKGFSPCTIQTSFYSVEWTKSIIVFIKDILKMTIFRGKYLTSGEWRRKIFLVSEKLRQFVETHISCTERFHSLQPLHAFFRNCGKDGMIIVGSDQVWRPKYSPHLPLFFCQWEEMKNMPHFAYAASFGVDFDEFTLLQKRMAHRLLPFFRAVSVREKSAVELCRKLFNYDHAAAVLDPTFLLPAEKYRSLFGSEEGKEGALCCYILDYTEQQKSAAEKFAGEHHITINALIPFLPEKEILKRELKMCSVPEWLAGIANAKYVMTDSFHGTVFSILFRRQFVVVANMERGTARMRDLLAEFDLSERLVDMNDYKSAAEVLKTPIDYERVDQKLALFRKKGLSFLEQNLR